MSYHATALAYRIGGGGCCVKQHGTETGVMMWCYLIQSQFCCGNGVKRRLPVEQGAIVSGVCSDYRQLYVTQASQLHPNLEHKT
jgi:hypothetical protein